MKDTKEKNKKISTSTMAVVALMTAVVCVLSPFSIAIGPVPISLATFGIYLTIMILGRKRATMVCLMYLLMGFIGLPVYSGFMGGPARLFGPTGGYLLGYLLLTMISGFIVDKFPKNCYLCGLGLAVGTVCCYIVGTIWLAYHMEISFLEAFMVGAVPFLIGDIVKMTALHLVYILKMDISLGLKYVEMQQFR